MGKKISHLSYLEFIEAISLVEEYDDIKIRSVKIEYVDKSYKIEIVLREN